MRCLFLIAREPGTIKKVLAHGEMREKAIFLKDIAETAAIWRNENPLRGVCEDRAIHGDPATIWADQTSNDVDKGRLPRPRLAEKCDKPALGRELGFKRESPEMMRNIDLYCHSRTK